MNAVAIFPKQEYAKKGNGITLKGGHARDFNSKANLCIAFNKIV